MDAFDAKFISTHVAFHCTTYILVYIAKLGKVGAYDTQQNCNSLCYGKAAYASIPAGSHAIEII